MFPIKIIKMGLLKKLFGRETKENPKEEPKEEDLESYSQDLGLLCPHCEMSIHPTQKSKKFLGKRYHIQCYRKLRKDARKLM